MMRAEKAIHGLAARREHHVRDPSGLVSFPVPGILPQHWILIVVVIQSPNYLYDSKPEFFMSGAGKKSVKLKLQFCNLAGNKMSQ